MLGSIVYNACRLVVQSIKLLGGGMESATCGMESVECKLCSVKGVKVWSL